jgi:hypothetical protein
VWITSFSTGAAIGPLIGGLLLERLWWGSVFLPALPVMGLLLVLGPRLLPEYRDPDAGRLDLISAAVSLIAVLAVIYGLKRIAQDGLDGAAAASIVAGLAVGAGFVRRQRRLADPLIDLRLFRRRDCHLRGAGPACPQRRRRQDRASGQVRSPGRAADARPASEGDPTPDRCRGTGGIRRIRLL